MQKYAVLGSHRCCGGTKHAANKYGMARANISTGMNEGVEIHCKAVKNQFLTVVGLLVELGTAFPK